jgi:homoserine kinase
MEKVFQAGQEAGAYHCIISGAGSTLMAYADRR